MRLILFWGHPNVLLSFLGSVAQPFWSAPVNVVSCDVSYEVNRHQRGQSTRHLHYYAKVSRAQSVVEPFKRRDRAELSQGRFSGGR